MRGRPSAVFTRMPARQVGRRGAWLRKRGTPVSSPRSPRAPSFDRVHLRVPKGFHDIERGAVSQRLRAKRWRQLAARFPDLSTKSVLDLGGTERSWDLAPVRPAHLLIVNANAEDQENVVLGDACASDLLEGQRFDLVYSNSVIEHVGGHWRRGQFAKNVYRLGVHHWVQTPYRFFPVEPHWLCPGMQFLPIAARKHLSQHWPVGNFSVARGEPEETHVEWALQIELLSRTSLRHYFSESELLEEKVCGLTKSLIAFS